MGRRFEFLCVVMMVCCLCGMFADASALSDGYILCGAYCGTSTILLDKNGTVIHTWLHTNLDDSTNGYSCYLLPNGDLLRSGVAPKNVTVSSSAQPRQGILEALDHKGNVVWKYQLADDTHMLHHDCKSLPNGNILAVSFHTVSKDDAIAKGIDASLFSGWTRSMEAEMILEIDPDAQGGPKIVWEWHILDHVCPKEEAVNHPELFSGDLGPLFSGQWVHLNGIDYNPQKDLIVFSSRVFSELYIIDHSTTTQEAAGHTGGTHGKGGDLLYRWGHPSNYDMNTGSATTISCLHCPTWIPEGYSGAGNIMFFHNNVNSSMTSLGQSQVIEITPPFGTDGKFQYTSGQPFGPATPSWTYAPADSFHSKSMSSAIRMPNGNTVIHEAYLDYNGGSGLPDQTTNGRIREVTPDQQIVWNYYVSLKGVVESTFGMPVDTTAGYNPAKIMYYPSNNEGIVALLEKISVSARSDSRACNTAQSFKPGITCRNNVLTVHNGAGSQIMVYSLQGRLVASFASRSDVETFNLPQSALSCIVAIRGGDGHIASRLIHKLQ